jgi:hypothetical protein
VADSVLLVDYENIGKLDLGAIPAGVRVPRAWPPPAQASLSLSNAGAQAGYEA